MEIENQNEIVNEFLQIDQRILGPLAYLIDQNWFTTFQGYVEASLLGEFVNTPGKILNYELESGQRYFSKDANELQKIQIVLEQKFKLTDTLICKIDSQFTSLDLMKKVGRDFTVVNQEVWDILKNKFGSDNLSEKLIIPLEKYRLIVAVQVSFSQFSYVTHFFPCLFIVKEFAEISFRLTFQPLQTTLIYIPRLDKLLNEEQTLQQNGVLNMDLIMLLQEDLYKRKDQQFPNNISQKWVSQINEEEAAEIKKMNQTVDIALNNQKKSISILNLKSIKDNLIQLQQQLNIQKQ